MPTRLPNSWLAALGCPVFLVSLPGFGWGGQHVDHAPAESSPSTGVWLASRAGAFDLARTGLHGLAATVDGAGLAVEVDEVWTVPGMPRARSAAAIQTRSFGRAGSHAALARGELRLSGDAVELVRPGLVEWFREHRMGVEQGWTIAEAPAACEPAEFAGASELWIGLEITGLDVQLTDDGKAAKLVDPRAQERLRCSGLAASDAAGRTLAARWKFVRGELGISVDDRGATYPVTVDPIVGPPVLVWESNQADARVDRCMAAGDVNGDGYGDFIASAHFYDSVNSVNAGKVWVFHGSPSGLSGFPSWTSSGPDLPNTYFGAYTTALGDITGDGFDDVGIGAAEYSNGQNREGAVFIYRGSALGLESTPVWTLEGNATDLELMQVRYAGDLNGDNLDDVVVSSHALAGATGIVRVYYGSASTPSAPNWTVTAADVAALGVQPADFQDQGPRAAGAGDINGDGYDDLLVGAYTNSSTVGHAMLYLGGPAGLSSPSTPVWHVSTGGVGARFGYVRPAGDVNGDGWPDVTVAAPLYSGSATQSGAVFVYLNNAGTLPTTESLRIDGPAQFNVNFGEGFDCTGACGDIDGDGFADSVFGTWGYNSLTGLAQIFRGSTSGLPASASLSLNAPGGGCGTNCWFGSSSGAAGDVDGDGRSEVFVSGFGYANPESNEGAVWIYYGQPSADVLVTPSVAPHPTTLSGSSNSRFGSALDGRGDVNGDGFSDLLMGSPKFDNASSDAGKAELHLGSNGGALSAAAWSVEGAAPGRELGTSVAFAGDVDNDGYGDVLVGEPYYAGSFSNEGRVQLFLGNASGALGSVPAFTFTGGEAGALLGSSVADAGDVNGDGLADVVVGAPGTHLGQVDRGAAYVFYGRRTAPWLVAGPVLDSGLAGVRFGAAVATAGDVNADGFSDVVVGAPKGGTLSEEGIAYLYLGSIAGLSASSSWSYVPGVAGAHFGSSLATAGDVDAPSSGPDVGCSDVAIGAPDHNSGTTGGAVFVFHGKTGAPPNLGAAPAAILPGPQAGSRFGAAVVSAGDPNGDGFSDLAVGTPSYNNGQVNQGLVQLFLGSSGGVSLSAAFALAGTTFQGNLGAAIGAGGDQDGDGFSDLVAGGPGLGGSSGAAIFQEGSTAYGGLSAAQQRRGNDALAIHRLNLVADSTSNLSFKGNSKSFLAVATTVAGRERIRLEYELKRTQFPLDGTGFQHGTGVAFPSDQWVDCVTNPTLSVPVPTLQQQFGYHWRLRVQNKNPLFPHSRWSTIQGNGRQEKKFGTGSDCNGNTIPDDVDIANLTSADCDPIGPLGPNGIPDECELTGNNLNGNTIPDTCEAQIPFCTPGQDGTGNCPCLNNPVGSNRGCQNSLATGGAAISGFGTASLSADTLVISASSIGHAGVSCVGNVTTVTCILLQGPTLNSGGLVFGDGVRCFAGSLKRINTGTSSGGVYSFGPGISAQSAALGDNIPSLAARHYLVYYRDSCASYCPPFNFNASNGWRVIWDI